MPKRSSRGKQGPEDGNEIAFRVTQNPTSEQSSEGKDGKIRATVELRRSGGLKGGKARAAKLSADERSEIGRRTGKARWDRAR